MKKMHQIADLFFGNRDNIFLKINPKCMMKKSYYKLGQLAIGSQLAILENVQNTFTHLWWRICFTNKLNSIPEIDDLELKCVLEETDHDIYDDLHHMSNCLSKDKDESESLFTISFTVLNHFGAINQFKMGLKSTNKTFVHTD